MDKSAKRNSIIDKLIMLLIVVAAVLLLVAPLIACGGKKDNKPGDGGVLTELPADTVTDEELGANDVRLTLCYFRPKGDYEGWNMWLWGKEGGEVGTEEQPPVHFESSKIKMAGYEWVWLRVTIKDLVMNGEETIGFIPRLNEWDEKDIDADRFIPESMIENNRATVYIVQGKSPVYASAEAGVEAAFSEFITTAYFKDFKNLYFETSKRITSSSVFKVKDNEGTTVASVDCSSDVDGMILVNQLFGTMTLSENIDLAKTYTLYDEPAEFNKDDNFLECSIGKGPIYSSKAFKDDYIYEGDDLGVTYTAASSTFKVWSPAASAIKLNIYEAGEGGTAEVKDMTVGEKGVWSATVNGDLNGKYYTYSVTCGATREVVDPYARSAGRNGKRGMILDLDSTDPDGWDTQENPELSSYSAAVIYEAQLRDLTINPNSGVSEANRGKFLGLTETGTTVTVGSETASTALDYLAELGVTQVHFQPLFDFASVEESFNTATYNKDGEYNWGYDPLNYNVPEGSYSSDPANGAKRVNEMKQMIMALHNKGIQVVMDVVYNHVSSHSSSNFQALMPDYYFRMQDNGSPYNGSGCGNETASEREMFRKFMIDSVCYWAEEYKIDGFRFDLMGLHDIDTMNAIYDAVAEINPDVMLYGEGWTGGTSGLDSSKAALQKNASKMPNIAVFNDTVRDGLKGSVFEMGDAGFVSGKKSQEAAVYVGAAGATSGLAADIYKTLGSDKSAFAGNPTQSVNYVSAHDNSTLWDKLNASVNKDEATLKAMNRLAAFSVLTSQGPAFFLAGEEMLRSKPTTADNSYDNRPNAYRTDNEYYFSDNSYKSPDSVNAIDWTKRIENKDMIEYYKALISFKTGTPFFQYKTVAEIKAHIKFIDTKCNDGVAVYGIVDETVGIFVVIAINANDTSAEVAVPQGSYEVVADGTTVDGEGIDGASFTGDKFTVDAYTAKVIYSTPATYSSSWSYGVTVAQAA